MDRAQVGPRFEQALAYTIELFQGDVRKGSGVPYLSHLIGVASIVLDHGGSEDAAIAALLHDALEDKGGRAQRTEIQARFGQRVAEIVLGCTDAYEEDKAAEKAIDDPKARAQAWRERKEAYIAEIRETRDPDVLLVSAADKLHNLRSILADHSQVGDELWRIFTTGSRDDQAWYYTSLLDAYEAAPARAEAPERFERLLAQLRSAVQRLQHV